MRFLMYIWQLPQNLLGLLVILFSRAKKEDGVWWTECNFGVSLGDYIILRDWANDDSVRHEQGHQKQSQITGWLYLLVVGIPSATGNLIDRWFHRKWSVTDRMNWYYNLPWEKEADKLGGVIR